MAWRGLRRFGQRSQELIGWFVESWLMRGCRCLLIGWLWCTEGLWVDGYVRKLNPTPSRLWCLLEGGRWCVKVNKTLIVFTFSNTLTRLSQALLQNLRISGWKHITRCHVGSTYLLTLYLLHDPKLSKYFSWYWLSKQMCEGLLLKTKDVNLLQWFILPITMYK